jgi:peptide/nickel transport system permease protein
MRVFGSLLRRLLHTAVTLFLVLTGMWCLFRLVPGDPLVIFLGQGELGPVELARLRADWGLDQPLLTQYASYLKNFVTGNLGTSFVFRQPVSEVLVTPLLNTLLLMTPALVVSIGLGVMVGSHLGWRRGRAFERWGNALVLIPRTLPLFWLGIIVLVVFAYGLEWFPIGGMRTPAYIPETWWQRLPGFDVAHHLVLPVAVAVLHLVSDPLLIMRTSMIEVINEDYVTFAHARGLSDATVRRIARRNALMPVVTYSAVMVGFAFGGQVLLEVVFAWPGVGRLMVDSVIQRDYPVAQAAFFLMASVIILLNLLVDFAYLALDPRVKLD